VQHSTDDEAVLNGALILCLVWSSSSPCVIWVVVQCMCVIMPWTSSPFFFLEKIVTLMYSFHVICSSLYEFHSCCDRCKLVPLGCSQLWNSLAADEIWKVPGSTYWMQFFGFMMNKSSESTWLYHRMQFFCLMVWNKSSESSECSFLGLVIWTNHRSTSMTETCGIK